MGWVTRVEGVFELLAFLECATKRAISGLRYVV